MAGDIWKVCFTKGFSVFLVRVIFLAAIIQSSSGYQCHIDWCNYNEYCCGGDICCDYLTGYWYVWMVGGVTLFALMTFCCFRYRRYYAEESVLARSGPTGYVSYGLTTNYGDPVYIHQQPHGYQHGMRPTEMQYISTDRKGELPLPVEDSMQKESANYYPPPYNYIERRTPTAPPYAP